MATPIDISIASIVDIISDYRQDELHPIKIDKAHVEKWINQFDTAVHADMLEELEFILRNSYLSKKNVIDWLKMLSGNQALVGANPRLFWNCINVLRLRSSGSQVDMLNIFSKIIVETYGVVLGLSPSPATPYFYLDDFIFTGNSALTDLSGWITSSAPKDIELHVVIISTHSYGEHRLKIELNKVAKRENKSLLLKIWKSSQVEDRASYIEDSEVFRTTKIIGDSYVESYAEKLTTGGWPPKLRPPTAMPKNGPFKSAATRDILEWELLRAGVKILAGCADAKKVMRPLGFSSMKILGFGATVATFRNCPNNAPLALWWGDPKAVSGPLAWHALLPRKQTKEAIEPLSDEAEDYDAPWETDASAAVQRVVDNLEFNYEDGTIQAETDDDDYRSHKVFYSIDELRTYLEEVYDLAWYLSVPWDGGESVFDGDSQDCVADALDSISEDLEKLGWEV